MIHLRELQLQIAELLSCVARASIAFKRELILVFRVVYVFLS